MLFNCQNLLTKISTELVQLIESSHLEDKFSLSVFTE